MTRAVFMVGVFYFIILTYFIRTCPDSGIHFKKYSAQFNVLVYKSSACSDIQCVRTCTQSKPYCIGFTYDEENKLCELLHSVEIEFSTEENVKQIWISGN